MIEAHIMIVGDERDIRELLRLCVESCGYRVTTAGNVRDAKIMLAGNLPDLALLDINLPDGNGMELCAEIRGRSDIPIILITCKKEGSDIVAGLEVWANDYIVEPFDVDVVMARIRAQLRGYDYWKKSANKNRLRVGRIVSEGTSTASIHGQSSEPSICCC